MTDCCAEARALYELAFPGEDPRFADALFKAYFPKCFRAVFLDGKPVSMLFSIPYPVICDNRTLEARYLYAIATDPAYRGRGYARQLIEEERTLSPVFLRPMSPSLFDFYRKAGLEPFSPICTVRGAAVLMPDAPMPHRLGPTAYLTLRDRMAGRPCCRMSEAFLGVATAVGGMIGIGTACAALYDFEGDAVIFKEWWGKADFAPHIAAYLGAREYELRLPDPQGTPFGVMWGLPQDTLFLAAMD